MEHILIVDDDPVVRMLVSDYLSNQGFKVDYAESGEACLSWLDKNDTDLLLLDLVMPDMNGIEVLKNIRNNPETNEIPVVMLSANTDTEAVVNDNDTEANSYLQKPFDLSEVLKVIGKLKKEGK